MTARGPDEASEAVVAEVGATGQRQIVHRANQLCRRAEPHTESVPCPAHLHEAQRQLFGLAV